MVQLRRRDVSPDAASEVIVSVLRQYEAEIEKGAILTVEESGMRCRMLPIR